MLERWGEGERAVRLYFGSGRPIAHAASDLGIGAEISTASPTGKVSFSHFDKRGDAADDDFQLRQLRTVSPARCCQTATPRRRSAAAATSRAQVTQRPQLGNGLGQQRKLRNADVQLRPRQQQQPRARRADEERPGDRAAEPPHERQLRSDITHWAAWNGATLSRETAAPLDGSGSLKIVTNSSTGHGGAYNGRYAVTAGRTYTYSFKVKGTAGVVVSAEIDYFNSSGACLTGELTL